MEAGDKALGRMKKSYLRQGDNLGWENLRPCDLFLLNSKLLGATEPRTNDLYRLLEKLFDRGNDKAETFHPFTDTSVGELSGGQRRLLAIASTLLLDTSLMLLDEPLSGLDTHASLHLMEALQLFAFKYEVTIVIVVHHLSSDLLTKFDQITVMKAGQVVYQNDVKADLSNSEEIMTNLHQSMHDECADCQDKSTRDLVVSSCDDTLNQNCDNNHVASSKTRFTQQIASLLYRLQLDQGWGISDLFVMTTIVTLVATMMTYEPSHAFRVVFGSLASTGIPPIVFANRAVRHTTTWLDHRLELDDRQIGLHSFQIATTLFTLAVPVLSVFVAIVPLYAILSLPFETYLVQCLYSVVTLMVTHQLGRVIAVFFRGDPSKVVNAITVVLVASFFFSGCIVASWKLPISIRWIMYLSVTFWAVSGSVMTQFDDSVYDNSESCHDFISCVVSDGRFVTHSLGFAQITTSNLSLIVLTGTSVVLAVVEYGCLAYRRR